MYHAVFDGGKAFLYPLVDSLGNVVGLVEGGVSVDGYLNVHIGPVAEDAGLEEVETLYPRQI